MNTTPTDDEAARHGQDDLRLNRMIALTLRGGIALSACVLIIGLLVTFVEGRLQVAPPAIPALDIPLAVLRGQSAGVLDLGIWLLMLTPILRVVMALIGFARGRQWRFVVVSAVVLVTLASSLTVALTR